MQLEKIVNATRHRHLCLIFSIAYINKINYNKYKNVDNIYIELFY